MKSPILLEAILICMLVGKVSERAPAGELVLGPRSDSLVLDADGALLRWRGRIDGKMIGASSSAGEIHYDGHVLQLAKPSSVSREQNLLALTYVWQQEPALEVTIRHHLARQNRAWSWIRDLQIKGPRTLASDLTISIDSGLPALPPDTWLPLANGVGASLNTNQAAAYRLAGALPGSGVALALPMVSVPRLFHGKQPDRLMIAADPFFSVLFTSTALAWTYPAEGGLENGCEKRTIVVSSHGGAADASLDCFFHTVLADVPPGPRWLHDIAMVDYDYMSDGGQGWFRDIDALALAVPKAERHKILLCLHGWYDFLGRYCFDTKTGRFDHDWTAFSSYEAAQKAPPWGTIGGARVSVGFANCKPLKMSLAEVHARLNYARSRGFRVGLYYADGMNAGDGLPDFDPRCVLEWGGWQGADAKGRSYVQNPLQPKVRAFYLDYAKALLAEFGPDIDMLDWDETFHVAPGKLGTKDAPGYADRAAMRLALDLTLLVEAYNQTHRRQIAFLTSDCLGSVYGTEKAPYALMAHGTFQDSWCQPRAWSYGIFPNYRNVLWSVCWWPVTKWDWIDFGVRNYQAAVSVSNGWGDDTGFSEMTPAQQARAIELFNWRKARPTRLKWFVHLPPEPENPKGGEPHG